jgi:hypothetical protein
VTARTVDEREHRRGLVLGLTMAEALLLLLFLLLLALAALIFRRDKAVTAITQANAALRSELTEAQKAQAQLAPLLERLRTGGRVPDQELDKLAASLTRAAANERDLVDTKRELAGMTSSLSQAQKELHAAKEELRSYETIAESARRIDPEAPPSSTLQKGLELLDNVGLDVDPKDVRSAAQQVADANARAGELDKRYSALEQQYDRVRRERENLMRNGAGTTYPSCWIGADNRTEFMFDVTITDAGVIVRDIGPPSRKDDSAYRLLEPFERGAEIAAARFDRATARLFQWSSEHECRFFVVVRDSTGSGSKEAYQRHRRTVEGHFYIRHVWR